MKAVPFPFLFLLLFSSFAQDGDRFFFLPGENFVIVEKYNLSKKQYYRFNKQFNNYEGHIYLEIRGILKLVSKDELGIHLEGNYYITEELKQEDRFLAKPIEDIVPVSFRIFYDGTYDVPEDLGFPVLQSFPVFKREPVQIGEKWQEFGIRIVDPLHKGIPTRVQFYCEYEYLGPGVYDGRTVYYIKAQYAMRYKAGDDPLGDWELSEIQGSHVVNIRISSDMSTIELFSDTVNEQYYYSDGLVLEFSGTILTVFEIVEPLDKQELVEYFEEKIIDQEKIPDVEIEERPEGVTLSLQDIHFIVNTAEILPEEKDRLDVIAEVLKQIEGRTFLVIGHTTDIGPEDFLLELSIARAKAIVDELIARGIPSSQLIYEGRGGTEPLVPNTTEENKQKNRRVEIIILED